MPTLFDPEPEASVEVGGTSDDLATRLVASDAFAARRGVAGRHPLDDDDIRRIISTLVSHGGRAHRDTLAAGVGVPGQKFNGLLTTLRRMLNVEGYPVIGLDSDQVTVVLDAQLLAEQFELGRSR